MNPAHENPGEMFRVTGLANYTLAEDQGYLLILNALTHLVNAGVAVEIGSRRGASAIWIAKALADMYYLNPIQRKDSRLYCVDPFVTDFGGSPTNRFEFQNNLASLDLQGYIKLVDRFSMDALDVIPKEIDLLFLDGDLSESGLTFDLRQYATRIRVGGALCVHDWKSEPAVMPTLVANRPFLEKFSSFLLNDRLGMYVGIRVS